MDTMPPTGRGRPALYYTPQEIKTMFRVGLSTVYKKPEEWGGRWIAGCLRFPKPIVNSMLRKDGILESK